MCSWRIAVEGDAILVAYDLFEFRLCVCVECSAVPSLIVCGRESILSLSCLSFVSVLVRCKRLLSVQLDVDVRGGGRREVDGASFRLVAIIDCI